MNIFWNYAFLIMIMSIWILTKTSILELTQQVHFASIFGFVNFMSFDLQESFMHKMRSKIFKRCT